MSDLSEDEYRDTKEHYTGDITREAMNTLIYYCKKTDCKDCRYFFWDTCGLNNPRKWRGEKR